MLWSTYPGSQDNRELRKGANQIQEDQEPQTVHHLGKEINQLFLELPNSTPRHQDEKSSHLGLPQEAPVPPLEQTLA